MYVGRFVRRKLSIQRLTDTYIQKEFDRDKLVGSFIAMTHVPEIYLLIIIANAMGMSKSLI